MYGILKEKVVLYVEDDKEVLENIASLLGNYFKKFYYAKDAKEAFAIFDKFKIDILLVDIELPGINGLEFIKKIREKDKQIPIVVISAYTKTDYLLESIELGLEKYIVKPFTTKKLYELLTILDQFYREHNIVELKEGLFLNFTDKSISYENKKFHLTQRELEFLKILYLKRYISYEEIDTLWKDEPPTFNAIRSFIKNIRKKLPQDLLHNHQSLGYYLH